jgi:DnaJ-class molecular chaperone
MARLTHPDAIRSSQITEGSNETSGVIFSEIVSAYKLLSDSKERKRYDRSLVAESFKREVEKAAEEVGNSAGPQIFAMLRRTRVTTNAVIASAIKELQQQPSSNVDQDENDFETVSKVPEASGSNKTPLDFAKVLNSAIKAGQEAS